MISINSGKLCIPENERFIGFAGDNLHSTKQFLVNNIADENCIYRLYLEFDDGTVNYFVLDSKVENGSTILIWNVLEEHLFKSGIVKAQIKSISESGKSYHTSWDYFLIAPTTEFSGEFTNNENSEFLRYEKELNEIYEKISNYDLSNFVTRNTIIAGLTLKDNISAKELQTALNTYPILHTSSLSTAQANVGQMACLTTYDGKTYSRTFHYCYGKNSNGELMWEQVGASALNDEQITLSIEKYLEENPLPGGGEAGKSAYEIALTNGFEGTEEEWLESLKGEDGENGEDGYSPKITVSQFDGGHRLQIAHTENTLEAVIIKDGEKGDKGEKGDTGADGYTPVLGIDYFTESDKAEIVQAVIESLGGNPVFGYVDENNNIIISGNLADETYLVKYEMEDGTTVDIGELVLEEEVVIVNQIPLSTDTDGTIYNDIGYKTDTRINSSGIAVDATGVSVTGFIPAKKGDKVYMKGMYVDEASGYTRLAIYDTNKGVVNLNIFPTNYTNEGNDIYSYTISEENSAYIRLGVKKTMNGSEVVTINQPIS